MGVCKDGYVQRRNWTETKYMVLFFDELTNVYSSNALQYAPSNGAGGLCNYAHIRVNQ